MTNTKKKMVTEKVYAGNLYQLDGVSLGDAEGFFTALALEYGYETATIYIQNDFDVDDASVWIHYTRPETDREYNKRLKRQERNKVAKKKATKKKEENERKLYERLKRKFEK